MTLDRTQKVLDTAKGIGVIAMVLVHSLSWIIPSEELHKHQYESPYTFFSYSYIITLFALFIPALAAAQLKYKKNNRDQVFELAALCLSAGFSVNFLLYGQDHWNHWDVLHFLGVSFFLLIPLSYVKNILFDWVLLFVFVSGGIFLEPLLGFERSLIKDILVGEKYTLWPLFPWFAMLLNGRIALAYLYEKKVNPNKVLLLSCLVIIVGLMLPMSGEYLISVWNRTASVYHPPLGVFISLLSAFWILLVLTDRWMDKAIFFAKAFGLLGRQIFWVFASHVFVGFTVSKQLLSYPVLPRTVSFVLFMYALCFLIAYSLEWISSKRLLIRFVKQ